MAAAGPDGSGYMNEARMISDGRLRMEISPLRTLGLDRSFANVFTPLGFNVAPEGTMVPTYPAGFPLHIALAARLGGWKTAAFAIPPLASAGCLLMIFLVASQLGLGRGWAISAALALAACPVYLMHSLQQMSDVLATFWTLVALWCALRANERADRRMLLAAGAAFAIGVWVRPTNVLVALPLAFALRWRPSRLAIAAAAALPFALGLMWWNAALYGSPISTGYGGFGQVIDWSALRTCPPRYGTWLLEMVTPFIFPTGLLVVFDRRVGRWNRSLLGVWFLTYFAFYSVYSVCDSWTYTRFLLPALPALIIGALFVMRDLLAALAGVRWIAVARGVAILLILATLTLQIRSDDRRDLLHTRRGEAIYPDVVHLTEATVPRNAIVISGLMSGSFLYYKGRFTVRWDQIDNDQFQLLRAYAANAGLRWYAALSDVELSPEDLPRRFDAQWKSLGRVRDVTLWELKD